MWSRFKAYKPFSHFVRQKLGEGLTASSIVMFLSVFGHFASKTDSSFTIPSGKAPRITHKSSQIQISWTVFPVNLVKSFTASASLFTPHCTAFTFVKSYSPMSRLRSEGVTLLAWRRDPAKLLAVNPPRLARYQVELSCWPTVFWLTRRTSTSVILALRT